MKKVKVYIPNLPNRFERKDSVLRQFHGKDFYDVTIVTPVKDKIAHNSLWKTFYDIVEIEKEKNSDYFIFCEDDHVFTDDYNESYLKEQLIIADDLHADILSGGVSWLDTPLQIREHLFWVKKFNGMQFTVVFNRFYEKILSCERNENCVTDFFLSSITDNIFVIYPFISIQKEFGYSDVTSNNNESGRVEKLFETTNNTFKILDKVRRYYGI